MATNKLCSSYSFKKLMSSDKSNQLLIREAIRKIALGRSMERINLAPGGMSGIGTARMIHGYVAKIHDNPSDEEFSDYGGTIDVGEYPDETASAEPVINMPPPVMPMWLTSPMWISCGSMPARKPSSA